MTRAQLLADYLGVTPGEYPGLCYVEDIYSCRECGNYTTQNSILPEPVECDCGHSLSYQGCADRLTTRVPGDPGLTPSEQAAWLLAMVNFKGMQTIERFDGFHSATVVYGLEGTAKTPDAACLAALLAADRDLAEKWEAAG